MEILTEKQTNAFAMFVLESSDITKQWCQIKESTLGNIMYGTFQNISKFNRILNSR